MISKSFDELSEEAKTLLNNSISEPKMYIYISDVKFSKTHQSLGYNIEIGIQSGAVVNTIELERNHTLLENFDNYVRQYFKGSPHIHDFPSKKSLGVIDQTKANRCKTILQEYYIQLLKIPGIFIFPPFLKAFELEYALFVK